MLEPDPRLNLFALRRTLLRPLGVCQGINPRSWGVSSNPDELVVYKEINTRNGQKRGGSDQFLGIP
jgi:hypothetical protein